MPAEMKILGSLFRLLCALVVLLAVAVYLDGPLQASLMDYLGTFTPEHLQSLAVADSWLAIAAGALLLLTLCCGMKLGWNLLYSLATVAFFAEVAVLALGPDMALPSAARGLGWEQVLRELALNYPVPTLMIPALCVLGCLCSTAPVRIAWTSLLSCALCYGCAELLTFGVQYWQAMETPFMPRALSMIKLFPWILLALPAVFFLQYCLFMALFETFIPRRKKSGKKDKKKADDKKAEEPKEDKKEDKPAASKVPATATATVPVTAKAVVLKRPVVHKKSPISAAPAEDKAEAAKEEPKPEEKKAEAHTAEEKPEEKSEPAPADDKKEGTLKTEEAPASSPEKDGKPAATAE